MVGDELVVRPGVWEKITKAFFKISRCLLNSSFSLSRLCTSAIDGLINLHNSLSSAAIFILRTAIGSHTFIHRLMWFGGPGGGLAASLVKSASPDRIAAVASSAIDSLHISHFGFLPRTLPLVSFDKMVDSIKLEYEFRQEGDPAGMVRVPGGVFRMGSDENQQNEKPPHSVFVSPYYMDTTKVTQEAYEALTGKTPWMKNEKVETLGRGPRFPAWGCNWNDAVYACNRRSVKEGLDTVVHRC